MTRRAVAAGLLLLACGTASRAQIDPGRLQYAPQGPDDDLPLHVGPVLFSCGNVPFDVELVEILARRGENALAELLRGLASSTPSRREGSAATLARMGAPALGCLRTLIHTTLPCDPPAPSLPKERDEIARLMDDMAVERFQEFPPPPANVRHEAARALAMMARAAPTLEERREASRTLAGLLWDGDPAVREFAISGLGAGGGGPFPDDLAAVVLSEPSFRAKALDAMLRVMGEVDPASAAATTVLFMTRDPDLELRCRAIGALPRLGLPPQQLLAEAAVAAHDPDPHVRLEALQLLNSPALRLADGGPILRDALADPDPLLRFVALRALGAMILRARERGAEDEDVSPYLASVIQAAADADRLVAPRAASIMARLARWEPALLLAAHRSAAGGERARDVARVLADGAPDDRSRTTLLLEAAGSDEPGIRIDALWRLGKIAPRTPEIGQALEAALQDPEETVRHAAGIAIEQGADQ